MYSSTKRGGVEGRSMKLFGIVVLGLALAACAPQQSLEELEMQAMLTGDWGQVEKRERSMRRKAQRLAEENMVCPDGMVSVCEARFGDDRCSCIDRQVMREIFANF